MPEYAELVGAWIREAQSQALHALETATEPNEIYRAQGAHAAVKALIDQFTQVFARESAELERSRRKTKGEN